MKLGKRRRGQEFFAPELALALPMHRAILQYFVHIEFSGGGGAGKDRRERLGTECIADHRINPQDRRDFLT